MIKTRDFPPLYESDGESHRKRAKSFEKTVLEDQITSRKSSFFENTKQTPICHTMYHEEFEKIKQFEIPTETILNEKKVNLGPKHDEKKYTLALDLDLTLVYNEFMDTKAEAKQSSTSHIKLRPYVLNFLYEVSQFYEIVIFTASSEDYANDVVKKLDPEKEIIKKVISRKNCIEMKEGIMVKDLRIFADRRISNILLVDDSIYSFAFQIGNGIPVSQYKGNEEDDELEFLSQYLVSMAEEFPESLVELNKKNLWNEISIN